MISYKSTEKNMTIFFLDFWPKKSKVFDILVLKTFFKQFFGYFWPLKFFLKIFLIFEGFKNEIFNIMFYYFFQVKSVIPSVTGQNYFKYLLFYVFKGNFCCLTKCLLFLGTFTYFNIAKKPYPENLSHIQNLNIFSKRNFW